MNLESITLKLRPRVQLEAMDLGIRLLQRNAGAVYVAWCAVVLPICFALMTLHSVAFWLPGLLMWWLKPLYDRVVLFVLSRAVFGERVGLRDLEWRTVFGSGLFGALTWRRFDFARSFNLPVYLLEGLRGKRRRQRMRVLQKNTRGNAVLLTAAFIHIEVALELSILALAIILLPQSAGFPIWEWFIGQDTPLWFNMATNFFYILALTVIEPLYVASGFTLYLNRRVELEAWDIEVDLRRHLPQQMPQHSPQTVEGVGPEGAAA
jgi:hypothetical protein